MPSVLIVFTSADKTVSGKPTGWYLPEAAHPYYEFAKRGYTIDFASPLGSNPPLDQASVEAFKEDEESVKFLQDIDVKEKLAHAKMLGHVQASDYDVIFYVGGHGPMIDLSHDVTNAKLLEEAHKEKKIIAAVCHGPGALVAAQIPGTLHLKKHSLVEGKNVTGFSDEEEEIVKMTQEVPFLLETRLKELGGRYSKAAEPYGAHVVADGNIFTGQNPNSARPLAEAIARALESKAQA